MGNSQGAAFVALPAQLNGFSLVGSAPNLTELHWLLDSGDDPNFTAAQDRRCGALEEVGLCKSDKGALINVPSFKQGNDLVKWVAPPWNPALQYQGGAALQDWTQEENYTVNGLQPPPAILHVAVHRGR